MTQADLSYIKDETEVAKYFLGSVLSGGNSDPKTNSLEDWTDMYDRYQSQSAKTRLKIPILYGVDAVHGHSNVLKAVLFPHNVGLGATRDAALVEEIGRITAAEVRATGIQWAFAPCVTVPRDRRWGRSYEGFAEDPTLVAELGAAAVRGLQGADLRDPLRVLACAKHYAGDGGTAYGTGRPDGKGARAPLDQGDTQLDEADAAEDPPAGLHHGHRRRRRARSCRRTAAGTGEVLGQPPSPDRDPEGRDGLRGLPDLRLQRPRRPARRPARPDPPVDQRRHGHGHGPGDGTRSSTRHSRTSPRRARFPWRASTTR